MSNNMIFLPDFHIGVRNDNSFYRDLQVKWLRESLMPYIFEHDIKKLVSFGDLFDRRKYTNHLTLDVFRKEFFDILAKHDIQLDVILGNHDCFYTNTNNLNTPDLFLGEYSNITIYKEPTEVMLDGIKYLYIPWVNADNRDATVSLLNDTQATSVFGHLEINGFEMHLGSITCSNGFDSKIFDRFEAVLSGHFHQPSEHNHIKYIGAVGHFTWADYGCDRGFYVFNPHKGINDLEHIVNPYSPYVKIYYEESIDIIDYDYDFLAGKIAKIVVTEKEDLDKYDFFINMIRKCGLESYKVIDNSIYHYFENEIDESVLAEDTLDFVNSYIEGIQVNNKSMLHSMFKEIYLEAINMSIVE